MFKDILEARKRAGLLVDAFDEIISMLERAQRMFKAAGQTLVSQEDQGEQLVIDRDDRDINAGERLVRRLVLQHLSVNPSLDLSTSLVLLSIVHDIERIGDYAKNLTELSRWDVTDEEAECNRIHAMVTPMFEQMLDALRREDADTARQVMRQHETVKKQTDEALDALMATEGDRRHGVVNALALRFIRRTSAHLSNVASGLANPLDRVGSKEV
jgi:phosphate transport system protein